MSQRKDNGANLEADSLELLLLKRDGPPSEAVVRSLTEFVQETLRIYEELLALAVARLPHPSEAEIEAMAAGREPISEAAWRIAEIWQASLYLEDAGESLAESRRPPIPRRDTIVLLRAALLDLRSRQENAPEPSSALRRFAKRLVETKA